MTVNTMFYNSTLPLQTISSNSSLILYTDCYFSRPSSIIFTTYNVANISLLPLYIFILYHGLQQWKQKRSSSSLTTISHSNCFTYHTVTMELSGVIGCVLSCCAIYKMDFPMLDVSFSYFNLNWFGQMYFHILTCVERYLAVLHPIIYLSLRNETGIRIRNICIGGVWLLCFVGVGLSFIENGFVIMNLCLSVFTLSVISFCSITVLCVLIGPGPGEQVEGRERTDQAKRRAFYTIVTIQGALVLRFSFGLIRAILYLSYGYNHCLLTVSHLWVNLPSSLVLPFLFLQRAGKLEFLKGNQSPGKQ